jgi:hypothetical protein
MATMKEAEQIAKRFADQEFFNTNYMSVEIIKTSELLIHLLKDIRTDNLPNLFEGLKVAYKYTGKRW